MTDPQAQQWSTTAPTYSTNVARISADSVARLVPMVSALRPINASSRVLDNGAGTGAVSMYIAGQMPDARITATDISPAMLNTILSAGYPCIETRIADARSISNDLAGQTFTHAFNTFMLQTITTPFKALLEMKALLEPGGVIGIGIWVAATNGPFNIWEKACRAIQPSYVLPQPFDDPNAWTTVSELHNALEKAGFRDISVEALDVSFPFPSAEAFADFWFGAKNPAAMRCMSNWHGDSGKVRNEVIKVVQNEYDNGALIRAPTIVGAARLGQDVADSSA